MEIRVKVGTDEALPLDLRKFETKRLELKRRFQSGRDLNLNQASPRTCAYATMPASYNPEMVSI